jgi:predicted alpha/beta hydrolase family esterase
MRDLYNRPKRLADWIKRVNEDVDEPEIEQIFITH